ncbi:GDP-mannose 4,6-dehydratase [Terriglobus albidus]|uniref:GDP-mannose 4,6-dehydratase n=1 Tax=Terriglobus albidus TaxID=1592106 RepID=UPI0021E017F7|nr:GDP-mannose 4,6-dehydratase [Terriglobus albidus]
MSKLSSRPVLITGGAGFIGCNLAERLLTETDLTVRIFDNLSRSGTERNLKWLRAIAPQGRLEFVHADIRNQHAVTEAVHGVGEIYHFAAQVAVTSSIDDPETDFAINAQGTFHLLEAARRSKMSPLLLFTSTNKVYGALRNVPVERRGSRYCAAIPGFCGVNEEQPLDFHSPYGCSKGAADQYVRDYARIFGIPAVVFRMSCIAGKRQFGNEDQGWVAHFLYSALTGSPIAIYGDGCQVRDVLDVSDLVNAMCAVRLHRDRCAGEVYNVGGGPSRAISLRELIAQLEKITGSRLRLDYRATRAGDQPLYVSDTSRLSRDTGWRARASLEKTLRDIHLFWKEHLSPAPSELPNLPFEVKVA